MAEKLVYVERKNTDSIKWDGMESTFGDGDLMALWVADMDFKAPKAVGDALARLAEEGVFGYYKVPDGFYNAFIGWEAERHGYAVEKDWLRFSPGIVTATFWLTQLLSRPGDGVMLLTPVYYPFFHAIEKTGRKIVRSELINTGGVYTIDFEDFERKLAESGAGVFILCSPHNPVGRVWEKWELERLCQICARHGVSIISDEIHQDLIVGGRQHIPTATIGGRRIVTVASASKTFNLAGLQNSFIIIPDPDMRKEYDNMMEAINVSSGNMAGYIATRAAFEHGAGWLEALLEQIRENYATVKDAAGKIPGAVLSPLEGTYLAWLDLRACLPQGKAKDIVQDECRLAVDYGDWFGGPAYEGFVRLNLATCGENIRLACQRLVDALGK